MRKAIIEFFRFKTDDCVFSALKWGLFVPFFVTAMSLLVNEVTGIVGEYFIPFHLLGVALHIILWPFSIFFMLNEKDFGEFSLLAFQYRSVYEFWFYFLSLSLNVLFYTFIGFLFERVFIRKDQGLRPTRFSLILNYFTKAVAGFVSILYVLIVSIILFSALTWYHSEIKLGSAYGFSIGDSKKMVYGVASKEFKGDISRVGLYKNVKPYLTTGEYWNEKNFKHKFLFSKGGLVKLSGYNSWRFYFHENVWDFIELEFHEGSLSIIHRHRQYFELP